MTSRASRQEHKEHLYHRVKEMNDLLKEKRSQLKRLDDPIIKKVLKREMKDLKRKMHEKTRELHEMVNSR